MSVLNSGEAQQVEIALRDRKHVLMKALSDPDLPPGFNDIRLGLQAALDHVYNAAVILQVDIGPRPD